MGVGETGQIIGETGVGETGVGEMGVIHVIPSQPPFGHTALFWTQSNFLNLYNFLINWRILMKIIAKCLAFVSLSFQVHVKVCNPISLIG